MQQTHLLAGRKRQIGHMLHDNGSIDQHQRKDTRDNTDGHTGTLAADNSKDTPSFGSEDL